MSEFNKYIVWVDYGTEGWNPVDSFDEFDDAADQMLQSLSNGNYSVVITEYIPIKVVPSKVEKIAETVYGQ